MKEINVETTVDKILADQSPGGAFYSTVHHQGKSFPDENGFITGLVLYELLNLPQTPTLRSAVEKALHFLERCESTENNGAFHFYPPGTEPGWMGTHLPPDIDDTVIYTLVMLQAGVCSVERANHTVDTVIEPFRLHYRPESSRPWVRKGAYKTWLDRKIPRNPVDCCVNTNAAALLKYLGRDEHPAYTAAVGTVAAGIHRTLRSPRLSPYLTPYYPHLSELWHALQRAVDTGVYEFALPVIRLSSAFNLNPYESHPVCGSIDGKTVWFSSALDQARCLKRGLTARTRPHQSFRGLHSNTGHPPPH